jgi:hypothetical protein
VHEAAAVEFSNDSGTLTGSWDTTLSYGQAWRIESRDCRLIATANGGCGRSPNIDDGNLNYGTDMYSQAAKARHRAVGQLPQVGAFVRASGFYDSRSWAATRRARAQQASARTWSAATPACSMPSPTRASTSAACRRELRVGRQAVSWGESTFIQNGISVINHFDVAALRVPGSELKEGFLPQEMVNLSRAVQRSLERPGRVHHRLERRRFPEASGSYFSANDFAAVGGDKVFLGFGAFSDQGVDFRPLGGTLIRDFQA